MDEFDIAIIGAGIAGLSAAKRATELNARVCLIESHVLGGRCIHKGLYPYRHMMNQLEKNGTSLRLQDLDRDEAEKTANAASEFFKGTGKFSQSVAGKWESTLRAEASISRPVRLC